MRHALFTLALVSAAAAIDAARAQDIVKFPTLLPTGPGGIQLTGHVYRPKAPNAPAVLVLHGCGGVQSNAWQWGEFLAANGYVALVLDSFAPRNRQSICANPFGHVDYRLQDAFGAAAWLSQQAYVDARRMAAVGFSHGGAIALVLGMEEARRVTAPAAPRFKVTAPFYPAGCGVVLSEQGRQLSEYRIRIPTLVLHAADDDWTPAAPCRAWVDKARGRGDPISMIVYPNAHHGFDMVDMPITRRPFMRADGGDTRGVTVGGSKPARDASRRDLLAFLKKSL